MREVTESSLKAAQCLLNDAVLDDIAHYAMRGLPSKEDFELLVLRVAKIIDQANQTQPETEREPATSMAVTFGYVMDEGRWDKFCEVTGINPWAIKEGLADRETSYTLTVDQYREIGLGAW